jgi:hypothetical protein
VKAPPIRRFNGLLVVNGTRLRLEIPE